MICYRKLRLEYMPKIALFNLFNPSGFSGSLMMCICSFISSDEDLKGK